jgi:hypothetical protein
LIASIANAKIIDPEPIQVKNVIYWSHENFVEAIDKVTNSVLWKTELYQDFNPGKLVRNLEEDIQWNIIRQLEIKGNVLRALDSKGKEYFLDLKTGRLIIDR